MEMGRRYAELGADELVYLDITATVEQRGAWLELVKRVAREVNIPFTVGGGIRSEADVDALLSAGADKVSVNSAAVKNPGLLDRLASRFGSQCVVLAVDARLQSGEWWVYTHGGRRPTEKRVKDWVREGVQRGAGEILLTSMENDGVQNGFALQLTRMVSRAVNVPVVASGGAGNMKHFLEVFREGEADAALAASVFHFGQIQIPHLKSYLKENQIQVRI
ncbi:MAG: imidazole glycerol phosphate synthase subunit HisF [Calditrichia bacterium]